MYAPFGRKRLFCRPVFNQFNALKQSAPANISDMRMLAESSVECTGQSAAFLANAAEQIPFNNGVQNSQACSTGCRMAIVGVTVLKETGALLNGIIDF